MQLPFEPDCSENVIIRDSGGRTTFLARPFPTDERRRGGSFIAPHGWKPVDGSVPRNHPAARGELSHAAPAPLDVGFLRPVAGLAVLACLYLMLWIGCEVMIARQTADAVNEIKRLALAETPHGACGFWTG